MSEQNVEVVRRVYEGLSTRRAIPIDLFHPDFEADARDVAPDIGLVRGAEGFQEAFLSRAETFDAFRVEIQQVINADRGQVVTVVRDGGRVRGSDAAVWNRFFHVWSFEDDKITRFSTHTDRTRAPADRVRLRHAELADQHGGHSRPLSQKGAEPLAARDGYSRA